MLTCHFQRASLALSLLSSVTASAVSPYLWIDYLFWKAEEDQLVSAANLPGGVPTNVTIPYSATIIEQPGDANSGVRLGGGVGFCENWNLVVDWTHIKNRSCNTISSNNTGINVVPFTGFNGAPAYFASGASSIWNVNLNAVDIYFSRDCCIADCASITPYAGIKWGKVCQSLRASYQDAFAVTDPDTILTVATSEKFNNFSGTGLSLGMNATWALGCNFSLLGDVSGSLLAGKFCTKNNVITATETTNPELHVTDVKKAVRPVVQMQLGVLYEASFCGERSLEVKLAYETQYWFAQWRAPQTVMAFGMGNGGDLSWRGLTLGLLGRF